MRGNFDIFLYYIFTTSTRSSAAGGLELHSKSIELTLVVVLPAFYESMMMCYIVQYRLLPNKTVRDR